MSESTSPNLTDKFGWAVVFPKAKLPSDWDKFFRIVDAGAGDRGDRTDAAGSSAWKIFSDFFVANGLIGQVSVGFKVRRRSSAARQQLDSGESRRICFYLCAFMHVCLSVCLYVRTYVCMCTYMPSGDAIFLAVLLTNLKSIHQTYTHVHYEGGLHHHTFGLCCSPCSKIQ